MKHYNQIQMPSVESYIKGEILIESEEQYSIIKNAIRAENEIVEIASATGEGYIADIVTFPPRRLSFFETIVSIQTAVKLRSDRDLSIISLHAYNEYIVPLLKSRNSTSKEKMEDIILQEVNQEISSKIDSAFDVFKIQEVNPQATPNQLSDDHLIFVNEINDVYNKIKSRIDNGLYIPGEFSFNDNHESITKKIVFDKFYNKIMTKKIELLINPLIIDLLDRKIICYPDTSIPLQKLSKHKAAHRHTFLMTGAPASGKGTSYGMVMVDASILGIEPTDIIKINTDSFRELVSNQKELGSNKLNHASFNYNESYIITKKIYTRLREEIEYSGNSAHLLIDSVYPTQEKINLGLMDEGRLHVYCISVHPEVSIERAFTRGEATGRYIDTANLLKSHRDISKNFHQFLINNKRSNTDYVLIDNNVLPGEIPDLVAEGNLQSQTIVVHHFTKLIDFINKENINISSTSRKDLYLNTQSKTLIEHLNELGRAGFQVEFKEEYVRKKLNIFNPQKSIKTDLRKLLEKKSKLCNNYTNKSNIPRRKKTKPLTINVI